MEDFKIKNFEKEHHGKRFPSFQPLSEGEAAALRTTLADAAKVPLSSDLLEFTRAVCARTQATECWAAEDPFDLQATLEGLGIKPSSRLFVNWYRFDNIDAMQLKELAHYFDDIWYQGVDDIDLFDSTCDWMVSIRHDGQVSYVMFRA